jgi:uncharacterized protein
MYTLDHVNDQQQQLFEEIISRIVSVVNPVRIICYGNRTHRDGIWSCFIATSYTRIYTDYDLLIVTSESQPEKERELLQKLSDSEEETVHITAVAHSIAAVNEALQKGSTFFSTAFQKGVVVYDQANASFEFLMVQESANIIEKTEKHWNKWFGLAGRFYSSAVDSATDGRNDVAVFMLHQTVELACNAAIRTQTGYRPTTHNLKRLLAMMENFTLNCLVIFPRITKEETELFNVLYRAYSDVRYKEEYKVSGDSVFILIERVNDLLGLVKALYQEKLVALETTSETKTELRELPPFESIGIDTFADIVLQKGEKQSIRIECDRNITSTIKTSVEDKRLWILTNTEAIDVFPQATIHITYATLNGLVVNHCGKVTCKEPIEVPWLGIVNNSRGSINLEIDVLTLDVTLNKTGNVAISGSSDEVKVLNHRSGNFDGSKLEATVADITIHGSGSVSIHAEDELKAELHGTGNLYYTGTPRIKSLVMEGMGRLKSESQFSKIL